MSSNASALFWFAPTTATGAKMLLRVAAALPASARVEWMIFDSNRREDATGILRDAGITPRDMVERSGHRMRVVVRELRARIRSERPLATLLSCDLGAEEAAIMTACRAEGVPVAVLQDGMLVTTPSSWRFTMRALRPVRSLARRRGVYLPPVGDSLYGMHGADRVFLQGEVWIDRLTGAGVPRSELIITGQPRYDDLAERVGTRDPDAPVPANPTTLMAFSGSVAYNMISHELYYGEVRRAATAVLDAVPGARLLVKPHPRCKIEDFATALEGLDPARISLSPSESDTFALLRESDVLLTDRSTVAFEALATGRLVISLKSVEPSHWTVSPYWQEEVALRAETAADLPAVYAAIRDDGPPVTQVRSRAADFVRRHASNLGNAAPHVARALLQMAEEFEAARS